MQCVACEGMHLTVGVVRRLGSDGRGEEAHAEDRTWGEATRGALPRILWVSHRIQFAHYRRAATVINSNHKRETASYILAN